MDEDRDTCRHEEGRSVRKRQKTSMGAVIRGEVYKEMASHASRK